MKRGRACLRLARNAPAPDLKTGGQAGASPIGFGLSGMGKRECLRQDQSASNGFQEQDEPWWNRWFWCNLARKPARKRAGLRPTSPREDAFATSQGPQLRGSLHHKSRGSTVVCVHPRSDAALVQQGFQSPKRVTTRKAKWVLQASSRYSLEGTAGLGATWPGDKRLGAPGRVRRRFGGLRGPPRGHGPPRTHGRTLLQPLKARNVGSFCTINQEVRPSLASTRGRTRPSGCKGSNRQKGSRPGRQSGSIKTGRTPEQDDPWWNRWSWCNLAR